MYKKINLWLAIAVIFSVFMLVSSGSCFAQGQGQEQGRGGGPTWMSAGDNMAEEFIKFEDGNGDGKVTMDEFGGPDGMFTAMDTDESGYIELSEAPTSETIQTLMGSMGGPGGGEGGAPGGGAPPAGGAPGGEAGNAPAGE